jgi:hypothetical protein
MRNLFFGLIALLALSSIAENAFGYGRGAAVARGVQVNQAGAVRTNTAARGVSTGPFGGVNTAAVNTQTIRTPGGVTVQRGQVSGASRGPLGGASAGTVSGTRITAPNGQSITRAQGNVAQVGPYGGVRVGSGSATNVRSPFGPSTTVGQANSLAVGPYGGIRTSSTTGMAARSPFSGGAAVVNRNTVAAGPAGVGVRQSTTYMSPNSVRAAAAIARSGSTTTFFTPNFYTRHVNAWIAPRWVAGTTIYRPLVWGTAATFIGISAAPLIYDYGSTVVIQDNRVYLNGEEIATTEQYTAQAKQLVEVGQQARVAENDEWHPLGVFGLVQGDETVAQRIFQLAVNKAGIIRGNYYDAVTDATTPVSGSVDKRTQRVAWSIGNNKSIVFEVGLSSFTEPESTVLIHNGQNGTQQMILVRLEEPEPQK